VTPTQAGEQAPLGKRERRKRETREAIVAAAERRFDERGFDAVTVAEIAAAADISVKTLFTYFRSKEDLVFAGEERLLARLLGMVDERGPGQTPLQAIVAAIVGALADDRGTRGLESFHRTLESSPAVASRLRRMWEQYENELAALLARERNEATPSPETRLAAAQLIALVRIASSPDALAFVRARRAADATEPALREWIERSAAQLGAGLGDYMRRPGPT
jgi:AcrR family transcriptional regulator